MDHYYAGSTLRVFGAGNEDPGMKDMTLLPRLLVLWIIVIGASPALQAQEDDWRDATGATRTRAELDTIIEAHEQWVRAHGVEGPGRARAELDGADLRHQGFNGNDLSEAILEGAHLNGAVFIGTNLSKAGLAGADFSALDLRSKTGEEFSAANLQKANLHEAVLLSANLSGTDLRGANLTHADLRDANLSEAWLGLDNEYLPPRTLVAPT